VTPLRGTVVRRLALVAALATTTASLLGVPFAGAAGTSLTTGVVEVRTQLRSNGAGAATGMVLTPTGQVLTNNHVIRGATQIRVRVPESGRVYPARVLGYSVSADVALLKLRGASRLETVSLGNSSTVEVGDDVTSVGNAGGTGRLTSKEGAVTGLGITITVSDGLGSFARLVRLIETSADLEQGDSGGALLDSDGRVIGMNAAATVDARVRSDDSDGYAIPINRAASIARQIESGRSSASVHVGATPFLGIWVRRSSSSGDAAARGVPVAGVARSSPAARAGIVTGDTIVSVNGHAVRAYSGLVALLLRWHPGDRVRVVWVDEVGDRQAATVTLASGPPQ
jgi:S1-C subfamily serine protease